jgi:pimeloyl-ACP methyl ester carboxylesterase
MIWPMKRSVLWFFLLSLLILPLESNASPSADFDLTIPSVELRPGVTADIVVNVYVNENFPCRFRTLFAVHGLAHTGATWKPFAEALFESSDTIVPVCRVVAINLPGRGGSSIPDGVVFGELTLHDHVSAIANTLGQLPEYGVAPGTIVAHSQGSLLIQMLQQSLLESNSSLARAYHIYRTVFLAPNSPAGLPWQFADSGVAEPLLTQFLVMDPQLGPILAAPEYIFQLLFFSNLAGGISPNVPSIEEIIGLGYNAIEPLYATLQLVGAAPFTRPEVDSGSFSLWKLSLLYVVGFEQDSLVLPSEAADLFSYLSESRRLSRSITVPGEYAVHDMYISDPAKLLEELAAKGLRF